jgi:AraC-like DNA-binding protein
MKKRKVSPQKVLHTIEELKSSNNYSILKLSNRLGVSRQFLYSNYRDIIQDTSKEITEKRILEAITLIRSRTNKKMLTVTEVATESGVTRQTISRSYKHLYPYIKNQKEFRTTVNEENLLNDRIQCLEKEISQMEEVEKKKFQKFKTETYSTLMQIDLASFESIHTKSLLDNLQDQNEELARQSRDYLDELSKVRAKLIKFNNKHILNPTCELIQSIRPNYLLLKNLVQNSDDLKNIMRAFLEIERDCLQRAQEKCSILRPDIVVVFQSCFSCDLEEIPLLPRCGQTVVIESNLFIQEEKCKFIEKVNAPVIAVYAETTVAKAQFFCETKELPFSKNFLQNYLKKCQRPIIEDGYNSVLVFSPQHIV